MQIHDPLFEAEQALLAEQKTHTNFPKIKVSRAKVFFTTRPKTFATKMLATTKFLSMYTLTSSLIFAILMGAMNFNAYSARIVHWLQPDVYAQNATEIAGILEKSSEKIAQKIEQKDEIETRDVIEQEIAEINPEMVYSRSYDAESLLSNIPLQSAEPATFSVNPQDNRILIPKLGKNVPLVDVHHDEGTPFDEMHEIFMEELKKWVVRYPGTAKPGEVGNVFIFGHSSNYPWIKSEYNDVFVLLDSLENGDEIIVYYNQQKFVYRVTDRVIVKPGDTKLLRSRNPDKKEISLMTCWPVGTALERLIILGELVENN